MYYKNLIRLVEKEAAMAVGERRNHSYQDANLLPLVAALMMQQPASSMKTQHVHGNYAGDEQTVPKSYRQQNTDNLQQDYLHDPLTSYGQWLNNSTYPLNHNVTVYPSLQYGLDNASPAAQGNKDEYVPSVARHISIPGTELLEQYINNNSSLDYEYDQVFDNLVDCAEETILGFSLEDCVNLEKLHFPEDDNLDFEVAIKKEKPDDNGNINKLDMMMNNAEMNPNNNNQWSLYNNYPENVTVPTVTRNDQTLEEPNNVNFPNFMDGFYPSQQTDSLRQPSTASEQIIVKADPDEMAQSQCGELLFQQQQQNDLCIGASSSLPLADVELIKMPVSRFNEFSTSLTPEQCTLAKDIRRRGKNKKAARLCRKRKIDNISSLEGTLTEMEEAKNRLLEERKQIVSETDELKRKMDSICEILIKGLNSENVISSSDISVLHHSKGHTLLVRE